MTKRGSETESERERETERARDGERATERGRYFQIPPQDYRDLTTHEMMTDGLETG